MATDPKQSELKGIYGRGWAFPVTFTSGQDDKEGYDKADVAMVIDGEDIAQSLQILFSTQPFERVMRPEYGCDLQTFVFENINEALLAKIRTQISDAVQRHEPRVSIDALDITQDGRQPWWLHVHLAYRIRGADSLRHLSTQLDLGTGRRGFFR